MKLSNSDRQNLIVLGICSYVVYPIVTVAIQSWEFIVLTPILMLATLKVFELQDILFERWWPE